MTQKKNRLIVNITLAFVSVLSLALVPFQSAFASTPYDDIINPIDNVYLGGGACTDEPIDVSTTYADIFYEEAAWPGEFGEFFRTANLDAFNTALENGINWAVFDASTIVDLQFGQPTGVRAVGITWTTDETDYISYANSGSYYGFGWTNTGGPSTVWSIIYYLDSSCIPVIASNNTGFDGTKTIPEQFDTYSSPAWTGTPWAQPDGQFFINAEVVYPPGYEGPEAPPLPDVRPIEFPQVLYTVDQNGNFQATYRNPSTIGVCQYDVQWTLTNTDTSSVVATYTGTWQDSFTSRGLPNANYAVTAEYVDTIPCALIDGNALYEFIPVTLPFNFSGTALTSGTGTQCANDGTCAEFAEAFCDALDSTTWFNGCFTNAWNAIMRILGVSYSLTNAGIITTFQPETLGIFQIIFSPLYILNGIIEDGYNCEPINLPLPFLGEDLVINCMSDFYETTGALFVLYQTIISGLIVYWVFVNAAAMIKNFKDPKKDQIEVLHL